MKKYTLLLCYISFPISDWERSQEIYFYKNRNEVSEQEESDGRIA